MEKGKRLLMTLAGVMISGLCAVESQELVESVAAIVGNEVVYLSDIENLVLDMKRNGNKLPIDQQRCMVLNELLVSRLFLDQARIDSITVSEDSVEGEVNMNINSAIQSAGGILQQKHGRNPQGYKQSPYGTANNKGSAVRDS
jgi:peptidyl-prolyl cis-trans isomerase SurA